MSTQAPSPWIIRAQPQPAARLRLFCFPYGGGGAMMMRPWQHRLPAGVELCLIQMPGRENRLRETPLTAIEPVLDAVHAAMRPLLDLPFAIYGHSLGALVGFETARRLRREDGLLPRRLLVSSRTAPQLPERRPQIHQLPDPEFLAQIRERYNGIPSAIVENAELLELFLPPLRADITILETYRYTPEPPLDTPISAFGGTRDHSVTEADLRPWAEQSSVSFDLRMFEGDHFFIQTQTASFLAEVSRLLM